MHRKWTQAVLTALMVSLLSGASLYAQQPDSKDKSGDSRAEAYYQFSMGHLYMELAAAYGGRSEYVSEAIGHFKAALQADPKAGFISGVLAELYLQSGQTRAAVDELEALVARDPNDANARRILGRIYASQLRDPRRPQLNEEMLKKATAQFEKLVEIAPGDGESWLWLARLQKISNRSTEAEASFKKALDIDPDDEEAMIGLASVYSDLGDNAKAAEFLKKVVAKSPNLRTLTQLATTYDEMHEYELAAQTYSQALEQAPGNLELKRAMAKSLSMGGLNDKALQVYQELVKEDATDIEAWFRLSQIYREKRDFDKAWDAAKKASALAPDSLEIRYNEVALYEAEGRTPEAIDALDKLLSSTAKTRYNASDISNRAVLLERLGSMYRSVENYAKADETFSKLPELDPTLGARAAAQRIDTFRMARDFASAEKVADEAYKKYKDDRLVKLVHAMLLADLGHVDEAAAEVKELLSGEGDRETYLSLAQVYEKGKQWPDMARALDSAEKLAKSDDEREMIYFMRGAMFERMKEFDAAEREFRKTLEINPENSSALNYLGYMFADRNMRLDEAEKLVTKALDLEPDNGAFLDSAGWVYFRQGRYEEAANYLRRSLQKTSSDPTIHDHLGDVYFSLDRLKDAIAHWESAIKEWKDNAPSDKNPEEMAKVQKKLESAKVRLAKEQGNPREQKK